MLLVSRHCEAMNDAILNELRGWLAENAIDAILIGSEDAHQSEYVCDADARRTFVSGFTGSAVQH